MTRSTLLITGFLKCGTTSLAKYLSDHPSISTPIAKELYYFIDASSKLTSMQSVISKLSFGAEVSSFDGRSFDEFFSPNHDTKYIMDATPFYYSQKVALEYAEKNPSAKIIFMVREPAKRLLSSYRFFQNMYQEYPISTFEEFVSALLSDGDKRDKYRNRIDKEFFRELFDDELDMGCYADHIDKWVNVIGRDRIFVGSLEKMNQDPISFLKSVCFFLNLDPGVYENYRFEPFMQSYAVRFPALQKFGRWLGREDPMSYDTISRYQNPFHRIPFHNLRARLEAVYKYIQHVEPNKLVDDNSLTRVRSYYRQFNDEMNEKYGTQY